MAKVFISFLGIGRLKFNPGYDEVCYEFEGTTTTLTRFAQRSIVEKHGAESFDRICLLMTPESRDKHRDLLIDELLSIGCVSSQLKEDDSITTNQSAEQQWEWFDSLQKCISDGDQVIFDFTHGFRSVPIIFSTAISFLQKVKHFELLHAYYGYSDGTSGHSEIIDMAKFYRINEWADGVSRLVDMADASKLAALAEEGQDDGFAALNDPTLIQALRELTDLIKNIDVNNVGKKADEALALVAAKEKQCTGADAQLLQMVYDKFIGLAVAGNGRYDYDYFRLQLTLTEMLLKHDLNMQAFTVMRECIASIGLLDLPDEYAKKTPFSAKGRKLRTRFPEIFVNLVEYPKSKWIYEDPEKSSKIPTDKMSDYRQVVKPFFERLEKVGITQVLHGFVGDMNEYRNGFAHAWTAKAGVLPEVSEKGRYFHQQLSEAIDLLCEHDFLDRS